MKSFVSILRGLVDDVDVSSIKAPSVEDAISKFKPVPLSEGQFDLRPLSAYSFEAWLLLSQQ